MNDEIKDPPIKILVMLHGELIGKISITPEQELDEDFAAVPEFREALVNSVAEEFVTAEIVTGVALKTCEIEETPEGHPNAYAMWCVTHDEIAKHCATNGDDIVCETSAVTMGCNCCPKNYKKDWSR